MAQVSKINMGGIDYDIRDKIIEQTVFNNAADLQDVKKKVESLSTGAFYGYFPNSAGLPTNANIAGYAYVGVGNPFAIWNYNGSKWVDSGTSVTIDVTAAIDDSLNPETASNDKAAGAKVVANRISGWVTPEDYKTPSNSWGEAIQAAVNSGKNVIARGEYTFSETIVLADLLYRVIDFEGSTMRYTGNEYAFLLTRSKDSIVKFGYVSAYDGGGCLKIYGERREDYVQYIDIYFSLFEANRQKNCVDISCEADTWTNEIRFFNGKFFRGVWAVNIESNFKSGAYGMATAIKFHNVGFEGVTNGVLINSLGELASYGYSFVDCRSVEINDTGGYVIKTIGEVANIFWVGAQTMKPTLLQLSDRTWLAVFLCQFDDGTGYYYSATTYNYGVMGHPMDNTWNVLSTSQDLNAIVKVGNYRILTSQTNTPPLCSPYGVMRVSFINDILIQEFQGTLGADNTQYDTAKRTSQDKGATWSEWYYVDTNPNNPNFSGDLNTLKKRGTYRLYAATNAPSKCASVGILTIDYAIANTIRQDYTAASAEDGQYWRAFRVFSGGAWTEWQYVPLEKASLAISTTQDLNTIKDEGTYRLQAAMTNAPALCSSYGKLSVYRAKDYLIQEYQGYLDADNTQYDTAKRTSLDNGATWTEWYYVDTNPNNPNFSGDLDTLKRHGTYRLYAATNAPSKCVSGGILTIDYAIANTIRQDYTAPSAGDGQYWRAFRVFASGAWGKWQYIATIE